jgi:hypothetical protein
VQHLLTENRPLDELLKAPYSFVNARLALHYGLPATGLGVPMTRVTSPTNRRGILGHASMLSINSSANDSSVVRRGLWVNERLLCTHVADPPADIDTSFPKDIPIDASQREKLDAHRANPLCVGCHAIIDPPGLGLEAYDATGKFRTTYNGKTIDSSSKLLSGKTFSNALEMADVIAQEPRFASCITEQVAPLALGRLLGTDDRCAIDAIVGGRAPSQFGWKDLVAALTVTPMFQSQAGQP